MGQAAAARAAAAGLGAEVTAVVVAGVGGGCDPTLETGTVVVATALCDLDGRPLKGPPPPPPGVVTAVLAVAPGAVMGTVASTDAVVDDADARGRLAAAGALVAETEAAAWAAACLRAGVALAVIRAVLDTPARRLGRAAALIEPGADRPSPRRILGLAAHPGAWAALPRLARDAARAEARAALAAVIAATALSHRA
jgi:nucleoside phosphorylase